MIMHRIYVDNYTARILQDKGIGNVVCWDHEDGNHNYTADETPEVLAVIYGETTHS
jgi:hypothetical protein